MKNPDDQNEPQLRSVSKAAKLHTFSTNAKRLGLRQSSAALGLKPTLPARLNRTCGSSAMGRSRLGSLRDVIPALRAVLAATLLLPAVLLAAEQPNELKDVSINGSLQDGKARLTIEGFLGGGGGRRPLIYSARVDDHTRIGRESVTQNITLSADVLEGRPEELSFRITGKPEIRQVTGDALLDWSVRQETNGTRTLVLRPRLGTQPASNFVFQITASMPLKTLDEPIALISLVPPQAALLSGHIRIDASPELQVDASGARGLIPIRAGLLPEHLGADTNALAAAFRIQGMAYELPLQIRLEDPEARGITFRDFKLEGTLGEDAARFVLTATARVTNPRGASAELLSGGVALTELQPSENYRMKFENGAFLLVIDRPGDYPIRIQFSAAVRQQPDNLAGWKGVQFRVAPASLAPMELAGLAADTQFRFAGAAKPERVDEKFRTFLPTDGSVQMSWKEARVETEGKLFFSAEMLSQITVSPGLMRQTALVTGKVMQGELSRLTLLLRGEGEIARVQGDQVLSWAVEGSGAERRLTIHFNQPQKDQFTVQVQVQRSLGAFPQTADVAQIRAEGAVRFAGYYRVVNEGAVRLEVTQATGLSQVSPEQFPESDLTRSALRPTGNQRFVYRFSSADAALRIQADQILPELGISQVVSYRLGENELSIDAEIEVEIREAPLREFLVRLPRGYAIARLSAPGLADYFLRDLEDQPTLAELRVVYSQPVSGRQVISLRLEQNKALDTATWDLPALSFVKAKSVRGHIGFSADPGFRLTAERTQGLTEVAPAFFPRKVPGLQGAFRLSEPDWQATLRVERLPQTVQADAMHLFSIGEGIAYGSSVITYQISGAPIGTFKVELSDEYFNVEFSGKDIRNWQKTAQVYQVQLHTPVSGTYTLLATYERPFKAQGDTLTFTGARPLDAQTEQGHTLVISAYQFEVKPTEVSPGLLTLETGEVPSEYRLFFDAPILAAYRYTARPFNLRLALSPLQQGESLSQVVDRASLVTRVSKEGQVLTSASYFVKNRGNPHFRLALPADTQLWSASVNGAPVVPVKDTNFNLVPLPQRADPNEVLTIELKLAARAKNRKRVLLAAPIVNVPVLLAEWKLQADTGQRLVYSKGSLAPKDSTEVSGFGQLWQTLTENRSSSAWGFVLSAIIMTAAGVVMWRWAAGNGTQRFSPRYLTGAALGAIALVLAFGALLALAELTGRYRNPVQEELTFLAPVQQAGSALTLEVSNVSARPSTGRAIGYAWPAVLALVSFVYAFTRGSGFLRGFFVMLGWLLLAWTALRFPNGAPAFLLVAGLFILLQVIVPGVRALSAVPRRPASQPAPDVQGGTATATTVLLAFVLAWMSAEASGLAATTKAAAQVEKVTATASTTPDDETGVQPTRLPDNVQHEIRVENNFAFGTSRLRWDALQGQVLPLLFEPAVLTSARYPSNALKLVHAKIDGGHAQQLFAQQDGTFEVELSYQVQLIRKDGEQGFALPVHHGLVNRLALTVIGQDVQVVSPVAVSVDRSMNGSNTVAQVVLTPGLKPWIGWKPRTRDARREKPVFYAEIAHAFVPAAGVIEAAHHISIKPAQGELEELVFTVPQGATIIDVLDPLRTVVAENQAQQQAQAASAPARSLVSLWRFDPDTRALRVNLRSPQSRPFALVIRSQIAAGPLPFEKSVGLIGVQDAAGQIGTVGVATGNEVQLDEVELQGMAAINLEDFPQESLNTLRAQTQGLTVRRAFRYSATGATLIVKAAPVEPDVRVDSQFTLSLGEDRALLAANANVSITRAGIFRLSFVLPADFDVETISSPAMSHWTESRSNANRIVTIHLKGRTEGQQQFAINLAAPGVRATNGWTVPQLVLREAGKQTGSLLLVPEQGMRLQVVTRDAVTQLDPQKAGVRQKGVLAFRILQAPWSVTVDIEQVDAWVQVNSLQHANVAEAQVKVLANLQYQIENTGLKALRVYLPTNAESVRFTGEQIADFLPVPDSTTNGLRLWEIKLQRRVIGAYRLQTTYQFVIPENTPRFLLRGIIAADVNSQRGYVTLQSSGRLQVRVDAPPQSLQPTEWQSVPRTLQQGLENASANYAFRLVEPAFDLPVLLDRHEAAKLLPARVNNVTFNSVVSDTGVMLTHARLEIVPGDKRLLHITLPKDARFWFAFVNQAGVWPWRDQDRILIPLEQQSRGAQPIPVEFFFSSKVGAASWRSLDLELLAPKFDLPLENISWRVSLSDRWKVEDWSGALQLEQKHTGVLPGLDLQSYLKQEQSTLQERSRQAENLLSFGNNALIQGDPQQARRAFQAAYGLSTHDSAFNEDARVQLHNVKLQQALIGLNFRQTANDPAALGGKLADLRNRKEITYSQQDAKDILARNTSDDNAALMKLAERIVQQQDAAVATPNAIRASVPEQANVLVFRRAVLVDPWASLDLKIEAETTRASAFAVRFLLLAGIAAVFGVLMLMALRLRRAPGAA